MGGKSPEHDVSLASGKEIVNHLDPQKYDVLPVVISRDGSRWLTGQKAKQLYSKKDTIVNEKTKEITRADSQISRQVMALGQTLPTEVKEQVDVVFIAIHGPFGEDGTVQGMLELAGLTYTGSKVLASALGMNKIASKKIWQSDGLPVVPYQILKRGEKEKIKFDYPLVIKPSDQGSSVGVNIVHNRKELAPALKSAFAYSGQIIVEKYIQGKEIQGGVLGNDQPFALPLVEIIPKHEFFDYTCKYQAGMSQEIVPARIDKKTTVKMQELAVAAFKSLSCRGFARIDMFLSNKGEIFISEINTIPGLTANSLLPKEAKAAGISFPALLDKIINYALEKNLA